MLGVQKQVTEKGNSNKNLSKWRMKMDFTDRMECFGATKTIACLAMLTLMLYLLCSCASDVANRYYGKTTYPPKQPNEVEILRERPNRPYDVIADFQSRGETPEDMRRKAAA